MHIEETFVVARAPEVVFDFVSSPGNLSSWQTSTTSVEQLTDGAPGLGTRFRERIQPPRGKEFEQVVEYAAFDRPRHLHVHVVEGPYPIDGTWTFELSGDGTEVHFVADGELTGLMKLLEPVARRILARQFAGYHRNLKRAVERG